MVQNWENFMMPDSGNSLGDDNALMSGAMGLFFGIGVDWLGVPVLNKLERAEIRGARLQQRKALNSLNSNISSNNMSWVHQEQLRLRESRKIKLPSQNLIKDIKSNYSKMRFGAKTIGWGLLGITAASIVEAMVTPGLTKEAMQMDNTSMGGGATYLDTPQSYTQRQRALMAIHESQLGIRGIISQEASGFHK